MTTTITVNAQRAYDVVIGHRLTDNIVAQVKAHGAAKVAIIHQPQLAAVAREIQSNVQTLGVDAVTFAIPDAEAGKSLAVAEDLWNGFGEHRIGRRDLVIGVGGGAATDLAGYVAACWMRGIDIIQVPTTLLAMVDAAVGGKTGINTAAGKNLVGAFHDPIAVFADLDRLYTLPEQHVIAGSAEIIKTGFIADEEILKLYEKAPAECVEVSPTMAELIARSVAVKARVVASDPEEAGLREILNYGHTFGHAVERFENYHWPHGNAVAVGMMFVAHLAQQRGLIDAELVQRHQEILQSVGLPTVYKPELFAQLYDTMTVDKKNRAGTVRFVALDGAVGATTRIEGPEIEELRQAYEKISS